MTMPIKLFLALLLFALLACGCNPTPESGDPDPVPSSPAEAASQQTELQARKSTLQSQKLCTPEAIRNAEHPDERWYHCQGKPWTGTTSIEDQLRQFQDDDDAYIQYCGNPYSKVASYWDVICEGTEALAAAQKEAR